MAPRRTGPRKFTPPIRGGGIRGGQVRTSAAERRVGWAFFWAIVIAAGLLLGAEIRAARTSDGDDRPDQSTEESPTDEATSEGDGNPVVEQPDNGDDPAEAGAEPDGEPERDEPRSFTIAAAGDLLIHQSVANAAAAGDGWDFGPMFSLVTPILSGADLAVCHVESPMSPDNTNLAYYPVFNVPNQLAAAIAQAGYDTCSLASNHSTDTGTRGVVGTVEALDAAGVAHSGMARTPAERDQLNLLDANGVTVAHLSYTYGFNAGELAADRSHLANVIDADAIESEARRARAAGAEFVIVSLHWGTQYTRDPDAYQTSIGARLLASPDIDLILGHHAHMVQPVEVIGGEYLAYGLGNFLSNQSPQSCSTCPAGTQDGVILQLTVTEQGPGSFAVTAASHTPTWVDRTNYEIVPVLDDPGGRDPAVMEASAARTAEALQSLGTTVPAAPPPG